MEHQATEHAAAVSVFQLDDPRLWVSAAFLVFVALFMKKILAFAAKGLDARGARIRTELDEAKRLRHEAEDLLAQYREKQETSLKEAESILDDARRDAATLREQAAKDLKVSLESRTQQALDKIAQEETAAVAEVRQRVVDVALDAARRIIASQQDAAAQEQQIQTAVAEISSKIH